MVEKARLLLLLLLLLSKDSIEDSEKSFGWKEFDELERGSSVNVGSFDWRVGGVTEFSAEEGGDKKEGDIV